MEKGTKRTKEEQDQAPEEKDDPILDLAIEYVASGAYPAGIPKQKKRAVRKRAANLLVQDGEVFLQRKNRKVSIVRIRAFQYQLQLQFPKVGGLQAPTLAQKYAMEPQTVEFVQVLNLGGSHWITVTSVGCPQSSVKVYDSMHYGLSLRTKRVMQTWSCPRTKLSP